MQNESEKIRVLQLIDSLQPGGAERVAVNIANQLSNRGIRSFLSASRCEGALRSCLSDSVVYRFLNRKHSLDLKGLYSLRRFVRSNEIKIVHAHASSYFLGTCLKLVCPSIRLIWHDHYGKSEELEVRSTKWLRPCSSFFSGVISVNCNLAEWAKRKLHVTSVQFIPNFVELAKNEEQITKLAGESGKRIICLANLRPQKDHGNLLDAFSRLATRFEKWTLHLVGKSFDDEYSRQIVRRTEELGLSKRVYVYGSCNDIAFILEQADIGVLSSNSEGLPLALLEYGQAGLSVVSTDVGEVGSIMVHQLHGLVVPKEDPEKLAVAIAKMIEQPDFAESVAKNWQKEVSTKYQAEAYIQSLMELYERAL